MKHKAYLKLELKTGVGVVPVSHPTSNEVAGFATEYPAVDYTHVRYM